MVDARATRFMLRTLDDVYLRVDGVAACCSQYAGDKVNGSALEDEIGLRATKQVIRVQMCRDKIEDYEISLIYIQTVTQVSRGIEEREGDKNRE